MNAQKLYRASIFDFILAAGILIFSFGSLVSSRNPDRESRKKVLVYENNKVIKEINIISPKAENYYFKDNRIQLEINERKVRILKSDCPRKICVHTGWIESPAQTIVCIPNKLLIEITSISQDVKYNAVSY